MGCGRFAIWILVKNIVNIFAHLHYCKHSQATIIVRSDLKYIQRNQGVITLVPDDGYIIPMDNFKEHLQLLCMRNPYN